MNFIRKLLMFLALYGFLVGGCALLDDNTPKKISTAGLISTPASYYSTAKARYLGTKYKENLDRLIERIVRDPKTTSLQFANNISSVGGIGFFTHSAAQSPDERYLEVVLVTPETFEMKGAQSEKVGRLFSNYGQALLGILTNDSDIFQDKELSGYGLNLAWRNVTPAATGNRVSMERAILYFSKERVRGFLRHEFNQNDLLKDAVIFAVEEDGPLQLVSYKPQDVRPDFRPVIREDNLASTDANQKSAQKSDSTKPVATTTKEATRAPMAKLPTTELKAEAKTPADTEQKPGEAIAKAAPVTVAPMTKAQPAVPPPAEPVVAKQSAAAAIVNPKPDGPTKPESRSEPKPVPPVVAAVKQPVVETKSNNATAPAIVPEPTVASQKASAAVEAKPRETTTLPAPAVRLTPATPLPDVRPAAVPAPTPVKVESLPATSKPPVEPAVAVAKVSIPETKTPPPAVMKAAEPVRPAAESQKAPNVVEAKLPQAIAPPAPAVKLTPPTPLPDVKPAAVAAPPPVKVESLPAAIKRPAETPVAVAKLAIPETKTPPLAVKPVVEPQKTATVVEAKPPQAPAPPAPAVKLAPATPLPEVKPAVVPAPTPVKLESLPAAIKPPDQPAVAVAKNSIPETKAPALPMTKTADPVKPAVPVAPKPKAEPPVAVQRSADPAVTPQVRDGAGEMVAGEQIALLKNKPVESKPENKPVVRSAPKALEGFIVQLAFSDKEKALRWAEDMERRGYAVSITEAGAEGRLRVRLGNFAQRDDAERQLRNFKQDGLNGIIINLPQGFQPEARSSMP
ncbi:MAG: DedD protein [Candidatus Binatota bacterium]|nr:DedD protein [Candidatus Binatota bacterium]